MGFENDILDKQLDEKADELNLMVSYLHEKDPVKLSQLVRSSLPEIIGQKLNIDELTDSQVSTIYDRVLPEYEKLKEAELNPDTGRIF